MRKIDTIVLHHSVTPQNWNITKTLSVIDKEHKKDHPHKNGAGYHISYHFCIFPSGEVIDTRPVNEVGFHAGNYPVNLVSIGVCLIGNFENDLPTEKQSSALKSLLKSLIAQYGIKPENIKLHKEVRLNPTACPGKNVTHEYIDSLLKQKPSMKTRLIRSARALRLRLRNK